MKFEKSTVLFLWLATFFVSNVIVAEMIGVKIFDLSQTIDCNLPKIYLLNQGMEWQFTAGIILWPFVFVMTDIINDYFGVKGVRFVSLLASIMILYVFLMIFIAIGLSPAEWWDSMFQKEGKTSYQSAFQLVFGQSNWIIIGSLVAFVIGQLVDALVFKRIKKWSGDKGLWIRATISTVVSQFIDSYIVIYIAFVIGPQHWGWEQFIAVSTMNFIFKFILAIVMIPLLLFIHLLIERYLGHDQARHLRQSALLH